MSEVCQCHKTKERSDDEKKLLINRLNRIEGQIRGIRGMVEGDRYCPDILVQASAVVSAIRSFERELLQSHLKTCVITDIREGRDDIIDELCITLEKLMK
ncbi:MAG: metal-sensing transcriptional repressor [Ruminococcaceae bacterium]|nr:metal-sensing transcriptional repressor [Oscillospiraceae bacterium]